MNMYGVINSDGCHLDVSLSLKGAKMIATKEGYNKVSVRYNCGYDIDIVAEKINNKWRAVK